MQLIPPNIKAFLIVLLVRARYHFCALAPFRSRANCSALLLLCCTRACQFDNRLHGQVELLALHDLGPVDVEEVGVEDGLDKAGDDGNGVEETLHCVSAGKIISMCLPFERAFLLVASFVDTHLQIQLGM